MKKVTTLLFVASLFLLSCNKDDAQPAATGNLNATWNLQTFDGAPAVGTMVFTGATLSFTSGANTENDTYVQTGNKISFTKTSGTVNWMSGGNDWTLDSVTNNVLRMTSRFGLVIRATK